MSGTMPLDASWDINAELIPVAAKRAEDGSLDEDVLCFSCGYNLRGLTGDCVCCPECGTGNDLREAMLPKAAIETAINQTEVAPATCVCWAFFAAVAIGLCALGILLPLMFPIAISLGCLWVASVRRAREHFQSQRGWKWILLQYHVAVGLYVAFWPIALLAALSDAYRTLILSISRQLSLDPILLFFLSWGLASGTCFAMGILIHRRGRGAIRSVQRARVLQLARQAAAEEEERDEAMW